MRTAEAILNIITVVGFAIVIVGVLAAYLIPLLLGFGIPINISVVNLEKVLWKIVIVSATVVFLSVWATRLIDKKYGE